MAIEFITSRIDVPRGRGRRQLNGSVSFQRKVRVANIALRGFVLDFVSSDHHINIVEVTTDFAGSEGEIVRFRVNSQYADKNFDDEYFGHIDVLVIADLQDA
ncbi:MAG: hypothetical protein AB7P40_24035 [Chloroflexota bacterium]